MSHRCVFIDRDGVINVKQPDGQYVCRWDQFQWIESVVDWIRLFNTLGYLVIVVTNQRCVAKGLVSESELDNIHDCMTRELAAKGAKIDDVMVCPHEVDACDCRKPLPGMIHRAREKWDIDLTQSIMIGDSESDRQLAANCELSFVGVRDGKINDIQTEFDDQHKDTHVPR
ncbi:MAG: D-glycero-alpha-D-manno-heptose-1,7-bisphosphate 7-phosphatase [Rubripirellula sp.]